MSTPTGMLECTRCGRWHNVSWLLNATVSEGNVIGCSCGAMLRAPTSFRDHGNVYVDPRPGDAPLFAHGVGMKARERARSVAKRVRGTKERDEAKEMLAAIAKDKDLDHEIRTAAEVLLRVINFPGLGKFSPKGLALLLLLLTYFLISKACPSEEQSKRELEKLVKDPQFIVNVNVTVQNGPNETVKTFVNDRMSKKPDDR